MPGVMTILTYVLCVIISVIVGYIVRRYIAEGKLNSAEELSKKIIADATRDAETKKKEVLVEAKEEVHRLRTETENENKRRRTEINNLEKRVLQREESLERKAQSLDDKEDNLQRKIEEAKAKAEKVDELIELRNSELQRVANLTSEEAKQLLLRELEKDIVQESAAIIRENEMKIKDEAQKEAQNIIAYAIQRCAADQVAEQTVSVVTLPNDEMKGRIIGREGRNIRAIEALTGVDLIIDDTPDAVVLSCFDPVRREVARIALEKLVQDGRIHPTRIEDMVEKAEKELNAIIKESGEQAAYDAGVYGLHPELIKYLGRLKYRTSYGQNVLKHSVEVSKISGIIAEQLGADVKVAQRAGLLHDLGKAIDHEVNAPHVDLGVEAARRYGESEAVINGIEAHHGDVEFKNIEAVIVQAADAISAARPGARRETIESYVKRLEKLEEIANSFDGIDKSFAVQAGREIRIIVKPEDVSEAQMVVTARNVVKKIEEQLDFPGQIKVNVIRETRAIEFAK